MTNHPKTNYEIARSIYKYAFFTDVQKMLETIYFFISIKFIHKAFFTIVLFLFACSNFYGIIRLRTTHAQQRQHSAYFLLFGVFFFMRGMIVQQIPSRMPNKPHGIVWSTERSFNTKNKSSFPSKQAKETERKVNLKYTNINNVQISFKQKK